MKIISWNVKGLGKLSKNFSIKEILGKYKVDIVIFQETKKHSIDKLCFRSFWGGRNIDWVFSPADGAAGGMLIRWKTELFDIQATEQGIFSLSIKISNRDNWFSWWLSCIYGPSTNKDKEEFWIELNDLGNLGERAWCVGGDLNEILLRGKKQKLRIKNS